MRNYIVIIMACYKINRPNFRRRWVIIVIVGTRVVIELSKMHVNNILTFKYKPLINEYH